MAGVIFYEGKSRIDGSPIVGIATIGSRNNKTGNLVQTWIMRSDVHPLDAIDTGADESICGDCPMRGEIRPASERTNKRSRSTTETANKERACYVNVAQAPTQIYKSYKAGAYPLLSKREHKEVFDGLGLRYGSYGDPTAIPLYAWKPLEAVCTGEAEPGYTHQWGMRRFQHWKTRIMASTHTVEENQLAWDAGWRTFRTIINVADKMPQEIICPASKEGGYRATCETCAACNGRRSMSDKRASVAIVAHGSSGKVGLVEKVVNGMSLKVL